jgi:hypothetical protein
MYDSKLNALVVVALPGWGYHEMSQGGGIRKARHPLRSVVRRWVPGVRRLLATSSRSHETVPQGDRRNFHPG